MGRRRGEVLDRALLEAACAELADHGYAGFTLEAVAARAGTSTPVLYRRWPNKRELLRAAIGHTARSIEFEVPDTGNLRGDILDLMVQANRTDRGLLTMINVQLGGGFFQETGTSPAELIEDLGPDLPLVRAVDAVYRCAAERGEIDAERLTDRMRELPFVLLRSELMMTLRPASTAVLEEIVDTLYLPLVHNRCSPSG